MRDILEFKVRMTAYIVYHTPAIDKENIILELMHRRISPHVSESETEIASSTS